MRILSTVAVDRPKGFMWLAALVSVVMMLAVALPTLWPKPFAEFLQPLKIDTDPENMLDAHEPVRVLHNHMKNVFALHDIIVVGVINKKHAQGAFNAQTLLNVFKLTEHAKNIQWTDKNGNTQGVISVDLLSPSTVDNIDQGGLGVVKFEWLMATPPENDEQAKAIAKKAYNLPFLRDTLVSGDQKAIALYIPITSKNVSYQVAQNLQEKIDSFGGTEEYHITGMPVAQDTFGLEMFKQMAISAPLAMLLIFLLMWFFFKKLTLIISPMIVAMVSVIGTMGLLVATGNTVHIMSSMIPVFIMPIAVLDAVHILSDFFDRYPQYRDRRKTLEHVMDELSKPMLFTSMTTAAGFGSLAFTPIPPVQTFGIFISIGVVLAWLSTITMIPAYIMLMSEKSLADFGLKGHKEEELHPSPLAQLLKVTGTFTNKNARLIVIATLLLFGIAAYGISLIKINDNPVKWFSESHKIRVADKELNERFAGTYMAYLTLAPKEETLRLENIADQMIENLQELSSSAGLEMIKEIKLAVQEETDRESLFARLQAYAEERLDSAEDDTLWDQWDELALWLDKQAASSEIFKHPEVLRFIGKLQNHLLDTGLVGKSNALPDIVKTVHRELFLGEKDAFRVPDSISGVAQTLITYQNSHRPDDLWHFTTPSYDKTTLWIQLKSGDNIDMNKVVKAVDKFMKESKPPVLLEHKWFGLTYINTVWQDKMVMGMAQAFAGSFIIVLIMMIGLFRSVLWGMLSMVPLTVTIAFIYGVIGLIGKDYDMPVAVLSSLSLGLAVDYAIHFLARSREIAKESESWKETVNIVFDEPARAIARNVIIIGVGFLPLLAATLIPYQTVGMFISAILLFAGAASLLILPALITIFEKFLFKTSKQGEPS